MQLRPIALAIITLFPPTAWSMDAQEKPANGGWLAYRDTASSVGIGVNDQGDLSGEARHAFQMDATRATLGELWLENGAGGIKLAHHWMPGDGQGRPDRDRAMRKAYAAYDRNRDDAGKLTLGGALEDERGFIALSLSHGVEGSRLLESTTNTRTDLLPGDENGRPYEDTVITTTYSDRYLKPFDWGLGVRAGRFLDTERLRWSVGLDYEWGKQDASQTTLSAEAEKYLRASPWSIALRGEILSRNDTGLNDDDDGRIWLMARYHFGKTHRAPVTYPLAVPSPQPQIPGYLSTSGERAPDAPPAQASLPSEPMTSPAVTATATMEPPRKEKRLIKNTVSMATDTYFKFDDARLTPAATKTLGELIDRLKTAPPVDDIRITGHTCDIGDSAYNQRLSERRAASVKGYLATHSTLPVARMIALGLGETAPKFANTRAERHKNRRVDVEFLTEVSREEWVELPPEPKAAIATAGTTPPAGPEPAAKAEAPARTPPDKAIMTWKTEEVLAEPAWIQRALLGMVPHKRTVDSYVYTRSRQEVAARRDYINRQPLAQDDSYTVTSALATTLAVLANDDDPDEDSLLLVAVGQPSLGQASLSGNQVRYVPPPGVTRGTDTFSYTVEDAQGARASATVVVNLNINSSPIALADSYLVSGITPSWLDVLSNDRDPDGDPLQIIGFSQPFVGTVSLDGSQLLFTPFGLFGSDSFNYIISDPLGATAEATVTLIDP